MRRLFLLVPMLLLGCRDRDHSAASAVGTLRTVHFANEEYKKRCGEYAASLYELSYADGHPSCRAMQLIDPTTAEGKKSSYDFRYIPRRNEAGKIIAYEFYAEPFTRLENPRLFVDQTGVIRVERMGRRADRNSPPIQ